MLSRVGDGGEAAPFDRKPPHSSLGLRLWCLFWDLCAAASKLLSSNERFHGDENSDEELLAGLNKDVPTHCYP